MKKNCRLFKLESEQKNAVVSREEELECSSIDCLVQHLCSEQAARPVSTCIELSARMETPQLLRATCSSV